MGWENVNQIYLGEDRICWWAFVNNVTKLRFHKRRTDWGDIAGWSPFQDTTTRQHIRL